VRWVNDAMTYMVPDLGKFVVHERDERWLLFPDGHYRRAAVDLYGWNLIGWPNRETAAELQELPAFKELVQTAQQTPPLDRMFNEQVGTALTRSTFDFFATVAVTALPEAALVVVGDSYSVEELCQQIIDRILAKEIELTTIVYLQGLSLAVDRLELEPGLTLERLTPEEVIFGLRTGMLVQTFSLDLPIFILKDGWAFALKRHWSLPRLIGEPTKEQENEYGLKVDDTSPLIERLFCSLALMTDKHVVATGALTPLRSSYFLRGGEGFMGQPLPGPRTSRNGVHLDEAMCQQLQQLWARPSEKSTQGQALELAIRRLSFAVQRERWDDRLVDLFVAAEAFYLTDVGDAKDKGELKYRLALRAAIWSEGAVPDWTRRHVRDHMKRGYDLRSAIVHGSMPSPKDIKLKGEQVELKVFATATEDILRAALHKALAEVTETGRLSIAWDDMILPE